MQTSWLNVFLLSCHCPCLFPQCFSGVFSFLFLLLLCTDLLIISKYFFKNNLSLFFSFLILTYLKHWFKKKKKSPQRFNGVYGHLGIFRCIKIIWSFKMYFIYHLKSSCMPLLPWWHLVGRVWGGSRGETKKGKNSLRARLYAKPFTNVKSI